MNLESEIKELYPPTRDLFMKEVYLLIGGNIGDRSFFLREATRQINTHCGRLIKSSSIYETDAWGKEDQPAFLNQVLVIQSNLSASSLMSAILDIEQAMGRTRNGMGRETLTSTSSIMRMKQLICQS
jgi:2-amino-4-hydroxy-6-hydroxymethyldihydropteridine diphosphokinase